MQNGAFFVLDGLDGSGKATQTRLLKERFEKDGIPYETIDFPSYGRTMFGTLLEECLAGKRGDFLHIDPRIGSTLYALDRMEMADTVNGWLREGKVVIADRFTSSNQIHQGGKIADKAEREEFLAWLDRMEHEVLRVPRPDAVVYLRVPIEVSAQLLREKRAAKNRMLKDGEQDTVERDTEYVARSYESALYLAESRPNWHVIDCMGEAGIRAPESIHEDVLKAVQGILTP